eukprot:TRINITY_DN3373_c0_g2_i1.p1 TRINITY_DN3373_c0_g2~~TRINITY_DN3373_c0_g2_i1.p1  ORF type:complete len:235 (+),score=-24.44 TRINITY_DN3373_c0_g2_i1:355-1059(+)
MQTNNIRRHVNASITDCTEYLYRIIGQVDFHNKKMCVKYLSACNILIDILIKKNIYHIKFLNCTEFAQILHNFQLWITLDHKNMENHQSITLNYHQSLQYLSDYHQKNKLNKIICFCTNSTITCKQKITYTCILNQGRQCKIGLGKTVIGSLRNRQENLCIDYIYAARTDEVTLNISKLICTQRILLEYIQEVLKQQLRLKNSALSGLKHYFKAKPNLLLIQYDDTKSEDIRTS